MNGVAPGYIKTDFIGPLEKTIREEGKCIGEPEDIGSAAAFICSEDGKFMRGETVVVGAGHTRL